MKIRGLLWTVLMLLIVLGAGAQAELVGCRTHMGEVFPDGTLRLYGCNEHGERLADGEKVLQAAVADHMTVILREDGTVGIYGLHDYDPDEIAALRNVTQIQLTEDYLIALKADMKVACVFTGSFRARPS